MTFIAEYAKSARAGCRGCRSKIEKAELRLGQILKSSHHSGYDSHWYHLKCFFFKFKDLDGLDIEKLDNLQQSDQDLIRKHLAGEITITSTDAPKKKPGLHGLLNSGEFFVEYAKSGQSHCISCERNIGKNEIRISQKDYTSEAALRIPKKRCMDRWHHVDCFVANRRALEYFGSANDIPGIFLLTEDDQTELVRKLPRVESVINDKESSDNVDINILNYVQTTVLSEGPVQGSSRVHSHGPLNYPEQVIKPTREKRENEAFSSFLSVEVEEQNNLMSLYKENLSTHLKNTDDLSALLKYNNQDVPFGMNKMIERLSDLMTFGSLERCSKCKGQMVFKPGLGYHCSGYISELIKCTVKFKEPPRAEFKIPDHLKSNKALETYVYIPRSRIIVVDENEPPHKLLRIDKMPLKNYKFCISDEIRDAEMISEIKDRTVKYGGQIVDKLSKTTDVLFSTRDEVLKMTKKIKLAERFNIPIVSTNFINEIGERFYFNVGVRKHLISTWIWLPESKQRETLDATATPLGNKQFVFAKKYY